MESRALCRVCLSDLNPVEEQFRLNEVTKNGRTYMEILESVAGYEEIENSLERLCERCSVTLLEIETFSEMLKETQEILKGLSNERIKSPIVEHEMLEHEYLVEIETSATPPSNQVEIIEVNYGTEPSLTQQFVYEMSDNDQNIKDNHVCPHCGCSKPTKRRLQKHIDAVHVGLKPQFECDICNWLSKTKSALYSHMRSLHIEKVNYSCEYCNGSYKSLSGLKYHVSQYHTDNVEVLKCSLCPYETKQETLLKRHIKRHSSERPYTCDICLKSFGSLDVLKSHFSVHTDARPFTCGSCQRSYKTRSKLNSHMRVHDGYKVQCPCCDYTGSKKDTIKRHMIRNHKEMLEKTIESPKKVIIINNGKNI